MTGAGLVKSAALNGVGTLSVSKGATHSIIVRGKSMAISIKSGIEVESFSFELDTGVEKGLLVIEVKTTKGEKRHFFVGVSKQGNVLLINSNEPFVPDPGRLGQIYPDGRIEVVIGEITYSNRHPKDFDFVHPHLHPAYHIVDADYLCKYMVSIIDKEQLEDAVRARIEAYTKNKQTLELEHKLNKLQDRLAELQEEKQQLVQDAYKDKQDIEAWKKELRKVLVAIRELKEESVKDPVNNKRYVFSGKIYAALDAFFSKTIPPGDDE